eukprot:2432062-Rhodomonas_salina.1
MALPGGECCERLLRQLCEYNLSYGYQDPSAILLLYKTVCARVPTVVGNSSAKADRGEVFPNMRHLCTGTCTYFCLLFTGTYRLMVTPACFYGTRPGLISVCYARANAIFIPAAVMQQPLFSQDYHPARNYGGIGVVVG